MENLNEFQRNDDVRLRKINNDYYILCGNDDYEVNETGAIVLKYVGNDMTLDEFTIRLAQKYNYGDINIIKSDISNYIKFMLKENIISYKSMKYE